MRNKNQALSPYERKPDFIEIAAGALIKTNCADEYSV